MSFYQITVVCTTHSAHTALQRHAWYPYFDDINAIIFLAPISCFDEQLAEDKNVNRLQDSLLLWKAVCSTKLLAKVQLILVSGIFISAWVEDARQLTDIGASRVVFE